MIEEDGEITLSGEFLNPQMANIRVEGSTPRSEFEHLPEFSKGIAEDPGRGYKLVDPKDISFRYQTSLADFGESTDENQEDNSPLSSDLEFSHNAFQYETWSVSEADVDGQRREVKVPSKSTAIIHWSKDGHLICQGSPTVVEEVEKDLKKRLGKRVHFTPINFNPDFLLWILSRYYTKESLESNIEIKDIHSGSISDRDGANETIHGNVTANEYNDTTPLLKGIINSDVVTRITAEFRLDDLPFTTALSHDGRLGITISTRNIPSSFDTNPYLVAASKIMDLQLAWNDLDPQDKYPNPSFFIDLWQDLSPTHISRERLDEVIERYSVKRNSGTVVEPEAPTEKSKSATNPRKEVLFEDTTLGDALDTVESQKIEAKEEIPQNVDDIAKEVAALSNHQGGALILGMNDKGDLVGLEDVRETDERVAGVLTQNIEPPIDVEIKQRTVDGADLLIVIVEEIQDTPRSVDGLYYKRVGTTIQQLSPDELTKMIKERD